MKQSILLVSLLLSLLGCSSRPTPGKAAPPSSADGGAEPSGSNKTPSRENGSDSPHRENPNGPEAPLDDETSEDPSPSPTDTTPTSDPSPSPTSSPADNSTPSMSPTPTNQPSPTAQPTPTSQPTPESIDSFAQPIRRLSHVEYRNTLRDLFPGLAFDSVELAADETIDGFSNHWDTLKPSDLLTEQYHQTALSVARALTPDVIFRLTSCTSVTCAEQFVREFGLKAFRRPLSDAEVALYLDIFQNGPGADDFTLGVQLTVMSLLQSGSFLYRPEFGVGEAVDARGKQLDGYETATRLSYFVWSSTPDEALLTAAERGELSEAAGVANEFQRLLQDPRAREGIIQFFSEWLRLPKLYRVHKNPEDNLDDALRSELLESAQRLVYDTVFSEGGTSLDLMTTTMFPVTRRVANLLGIEDVPNGWSLVEVDPAQRSGVLTHPAFLAAHGYGGYPSPVLRGVYIMDRLLCSPPSPPPANVNITLPSEPSEASEPRTNREAYVQATSGDGCIGCHSVINSLGFAFENYDTMGRYRTEDSGIAVDASGSSLGFEFENGVELIRQLAEHSAYQRCVVKKVLSYGLGGSPVAADAALQNEVLSAFAENGYSLEGLFSSVAAHERFSRWLAVGEQSP